MVITHDYGRLQILNSRLTNLIHNQNLIHDDNNNHNNSITPVNLTKNIYSIPKNL